VSQAIPRTTRSGIHRTRSRPRSSRYHSVRPPNPTSCATSVRTISHGLPKRSQLSVRSTCQPSRISWSKMPYS
jgi:hypothetical protein